MRIITLLDWLKSVGGTATEAGEYLLSLFGTEPLSYMSYWNGKHDHRQIDSEVIYLTETLEPIKITTCIGTNIKFVWYANVACHDTLDNEQEYVFYDFDEFESNVKAEISTIPEY